MPKVQNHPAGTGSRSADTAAPFEPAGSLGILLPACLTGLSVFFGIRAAVGFVAANPDRLPDWLTMDLVMRFAGADIIQGQTAIFIGLLVYAPLRSFISARDHARALQYLKAIHDANTVRAEAVLRRVEAAEANRLAPLGFCIWVLPVTGFIGTVVGVSGAIGPLSELGSPTGGTNLAPKILAELRYAFDTTLVGLLYVLPAMLIQLAAQADTRKVVADLAIEVDRTLVAGS